MKRFVPLGLVLTILLAIFVLGITVSCAPLSALTPADSEASIAAGISAPPTRPPSPLSTSFPGPASDAPEYLPSGPSPTRLPGVTGFVPISPTANVTDNLTGIYIGSIHSGHTLYSDGKLQYPEEFYSTFSKYWDWVSTTDHGGSIDAEEWRQTVEGADRYNRGGFVALVGYEWTSRNWGHLSVVFGGRPSPTEAGLAKSTDPAYDTPGKLRDFLRSNNGIACYTHPSLPGIGIDFSRESDYRDDDVSPLAEIFGSEDTNHWNATWDYADGRQIPAISSRPTNNAGWVKSALDRGYRVGFVGALDFHGRELDPASYRYTGVVAGALTRQGIFEALTHRHTYAVRSPSGLGKRILLRADAGRYTMGDVFQSNSNAVKVLLRGKTDLGGFQLVNVFVNGKIVESRSVSGQKLRERFSLDLKDGDNYTFFEVKAAAADGQLSQAITSPMFVKVEKLPWPEGFDPTR